MTNPVIALRLDPDLAEWLTRYASEIEVAETPAGLIPLDRSALIREVLGALRERRLYASHTPHPHVINDGSDPRFPVVVCLSPRSGR